MTVPRLECKECGAVQQENIHFVRGKERYTYRMKRFVLDLCRIGTIADVARQVHMSWDTVKDILKAELGRKYSRPVLNGLRYIGIDEFAVAKGHVYMTIVVDFLRRVWWQDNKHDASMVLDDWIEQAKQSGLKPLESIAETLARHQEGILAWYDYRISNGKLEGINNKIKTMKRQAYGYRDMPFFILKLLSLHDSTYPFSG